MNLWGGFSSALVAWTQKPSLTINHHIGGTGYRRMRDVVTLMDAICDAYDNPAFQPLEDGTTFCNLGVASVAHAMGCSDLGSKTADEMLAFIEASDSWSPVPFDRAQELANQGTLLVAGLTADQLRQGHGHVVVIRPGKPCYSGKWTSPTPRCLNIGKENFLARAKRGPLIGMAAGLNQAFQDMPRIWAWRNSL